MKNIKDYVILERIGVDDIERVIVEKSDIEETPVHCLYNNYGVMLSGYEAGDFSPAGDRDNFITLMEEQLQDKFPDVDFWELEYDGADDDPAPTADEFTLDGEPLPEDLGKAVEDFCRENISFPMVKALTYFDGHNFQSIVIESKTFDTEWNVADMDDDERDSILSDWQDAIEHEVPEEGGYKLYRGERFDYFVSLWEGDNWCLCHIEEKQDEK